MADATPGALVVKTVAQILRIGLMVLVAAIGVETAFTNPNPVVGGIVLLAATLLIFAIAAVYSRFLNWYFDGAKAVPWLHDD